MTPRFRVVCFWILCSCVAIAHAADEPDPFAKAREHLQKGRYEEALEAFDDLEKAKADPVRIAVGRSMAHQAEGRWKDATAVLVAATAASPRSAELRARLAEVRFHQGQYADAQKDVDQAQKLDAKSLRAKLVQAELMTETGRIKEAAEAWRQFVRYYNQNQPEDAETLLLVGRGSVMYARWFSVSSVFTFVVNTLCPDAIKDDPLSWEAWHLSGATLLEKYNREQAVPDLKKALAINPRAAAVLVDLGDAALQENDFDEAIDYADQALQIDPKHVAALCLKADVLIARGRVGEAQKLAEEALTVNPHEQRTLARLAACLLLEDGLPPAKEFDGLLSNLDNLKEVKIDSPSRFSKLVMDLAKRNPRPGYFLSDLGDLLASRRQYDAAEKVLRHAVAVMPQLTAPKNELGMLCMRIGKMDEARRILDDAFKSDPYHVRVSNMRKVLRLLEGYGTIQTDHFVIRYDTEQDRILATYMSEYLEEIYPDLVKHFGYEPETRTSFEIYHKGKGLSAHQWFSARMVGLPWIQTIGASTGVIVALASPTAVDQSFNWARVLKHEFVHVITLQQTKFNIPHWFTEALAVTSEGYPRPAKWDELLRERVPKGELRSLDELNEGFQRPKSADDWQFAYCQSRLYAQYMIEKFGPETISKMLDEYRRNVPTDKAIPKVFGVSRDEFEKGYREFLKAIVAEIQEGEEPEDEKPLADLEKAHLADKDDTKAAAAYALGLLEAGRRKEARELAETVLEKNAGEAKAALVVAVLEVRAENLDKAIEILDAALNREKPDKDVLISLVKLRLKEGQHAEAAELVELGREKFPHELDLIKQASAVYAKLEEPEKLREVLLLLSDRDPDDASSRKRLAAMALSDKNHADAVRYARMAIQVDVLDSETHRILAQAYAATNEPKKSLREWQFAVDSDKDDEAALYGLANAQLESGDKPAARKTVEALLKKNADHAEGKALLEKLGEP